LHRLESHRRVLTSRDPLLFIPREVAARSAPAVLLLDDDNLIMATNERSAQILRGYGKLEPVGASPAGFPAWLADPLERLRERLSAGDAVAWVAISRELFASGTMLGDGVRQYLLLAFERLRRDHVALSLARYDFTPRELEVAELVLSGLSNRGIAHKMRITESTVESYIKGIFSKMHVRSRVEIVTRLIGTSSEFEATPKPDQERKR
jgi:DNA-binding CsgD family transcriptional regulator